MKKIYFTPGPSQLYPSFKHHMGEAIKEDIGSISHRSLKFKRIYQDTVSSLKRLMDIPPGHHVLFLSSSLESMERIVESCVEKHSYHLVNGSFSQKFHEIALEVKKDAKKTEAIWGEGFNMESLKIPKMSEIICVTQNETSTGVSIPMEEIYKLKSVYPEKLLVADVVSSIPYPKIDFNKIDAVFFSVQKGFGLPAGLSILIVNDLIIKKAKLLKKKGQNVGSYHNLISLYEKSLIEQTPETPNVINIYLLGKVCREMLKIGIAEIRKRTEAKADLIYQYFDRHPNYLPFVGNKRWRSKTTIAINVKGKSDQVVRRLEKLGLIVGKGYGKFKNDHVRIANFPSHRLKDVRILLRNF